MSASTPQSFTTKLVLTLVLLLLGIVPGLIALAVFGKEAREAQARAAYPIPGAAGLAFLNRFVFIIIAVGLLLLTLAFLIPLLFNK